MPDGIRFLALILRSPVPDSVLCLASGRRHHASARNRETPIGPDRGRLGPDCWSIATKAAPRCCTEPCGVGPLVADQPRNGRDDVVSAVGATDSKKGKRLAGRRNRPRQISQDEGTNGGQSEGGQEEAPHINPLSLRSRVARGSWHLGPASMALLARIHRNTGGPGRPRAGRPSGRLTEQSGRPDGSMAACVRVQASPDGPIGSR